jgi:glycosyltransferase involved in cell wall biosynthesis
LCPEISIIVPVYNVEEYLPRCIDSILNQTFPDFELILVNDGSPGNCGKICDDFAKRDNRIKVIHKKNGGAASARNAGINHAKGRYIAFVDGDDYIHYKMFDLLYSTMKECSSDLVACNFVKVTNYNSKLEETAIHNFHEENYSNLEALEQLFIMKNKEHFSNAGNNLIWVLPVNKLYKRELFEKNRFEEGKICEDEFITHKLLYDCKKITYIPVTLYYYFQRSNSVMNSPYSIRRLDKVDALYDRVIFFKKQRLYHLCNLAIKSYIDAFFWNYFKAELEISNNRETLTKLKQQIKSLLIYIINNSNLKLKLKLSIIIFVFNTNVYKSLFQKNQMV